jgi:hypothetical protein
VGKIGFVKMRKKVGLCARLWRLCKNLISTADSGKNFHCIERMKLSQKEILSSGNQTAV